MIVQILENEGDTVNSYIQFGKTIKEAWDKIDKGVIDIDYVDKVIIIDTETQVAVETPTANYIPKVGWEYIESWEELYNKIKN